MVVESWDQERVDRVFRALADATRRDIVARVLQGERPVTELARDYPMSFAAVQKHVAVLDEPEALWRERVDRMRDLLAEPDQGE